MHDSTGALEPGGLAPTWLSLGLMTSLTFYLGNQWVDKIENLGMPSFLSPNTLIQQASIEKTS